MIKIGRTYYVYAVTVQISLMGFQNVSLTSEVGTAHWVSDIVQVTMRQAEVTTMFRRMASSGDELMWTSKFVRGTLILTQIRWSKKDRSAASLLSRPSVDLMELHKHCVHKSRLPRASKLARFAQLQLNCMNMCLTSTKLNIFY